MISRPRWRQWVMDEHAARPGILTVEVSRCRADLETVDWLARLALLARRGGRRVAVTGASRELAQLIELAGLSETLGVSPAAAAGRTGGTGARCPGRT